MFLFCEKLNDEHAKFVPPKFATLHQVKSSALMDRRPKRTKGPASTSKPGRTLHALSQQLAVGCAAPAGKSGPFLAEIVRDEIVKLADNNAKATLLVMTFAFIAHNLDRKTLGFDEANCISEAVDTEADAGKSKRVRDGDYEEPTRPPGASDQARLEAVMRIASHIDAEISGDPDDDNYDHASIYGSIPEKVVKIIRSTLNKLNANAHLMKADRNADIALDMALKWIETSKGELKTYDGTTISKESCNAYVTAMAPESGTGGGGGGGGGGGVIAAAGVLMVRKEIKELKSNYPENFHIKFAQLLTKVSAR